jgi:PAS domain S-box-containing protein
MKGYCSLNSAFCCVVAIKKMGCPIKLNNKSVDTNLRVDTDLTILTKGDNSISSIIESNVKEVDDRPRYPDLYEEFDEAFIAFDWNLTIIHWNKAAERVTTVKTKDALGKKINDILPEMMTVDLAPHIALLQQRKRARFMMNTISRETQKPSIFEISLYPSEQGVIVVVEDKTEEEKTKRLSAIGATAGMVGHDIRNPLQAIVGDIYLLKEYLASMPESETQKEVAESLDNIETNVNYINKIVSDLLDYSRSINPEYSDFNLKDLIETILQSVNRQNDLDISVNIDPSFTITSDRSITRRILTNLIVNAIQAMPTGGKIRLSSFREEGNVLIMVEDTGVGIPEDIKPKLFSPMFTTKAKGQGLGLAVVKRLVEALNGTISFESQEGKGTKFVIALPFSK